MGTTTQYVIPGLEAYESSARKPRTDHIGVPFRWERVDYLMSLPSTDFGEEGLTEANARDKRSDPGYEALVESILEHGFYDPVFVYPVNSEDSISYDQEELGNGHHRVVAAHDVGFTHVPVTSDPMVQWDTSYPGHPDYTG